MNYDIIIIGSGPAGVSAALYAKRSNITTLIISKNEGNLHKAELIENYYGLSKPLTGTELFNIGLQQAQRLKIDIKEE
ncbi:MAG: FAD-dependent oxidoreductase, partial [Bacilli bacterium]